MDLGLDRIQPRACALLPDKDVEIIVIVAPFTREEAKRE
jgi:hypothetical protein